MKNFLLLVLFSFAFLFSANAQTKSWSLHAGTDKIVPDKAVARLSFPQEYKLFDLNIDPFKEELFKVVNNSARHSTVISLPNTDGQIEEFEVFEASNFAPELQAQFPEIRAFSGRGITDKSATLKLSISPQGLQTMIFRTEKENEFIEAYSADHTIYAVFKSHRMTGTLPWSCSTQDQNLAVGLNTEVAKTNITARSTGDLKTLRLAQSVTAEYSNYFGATSASQVGLVLAGINATITRCNGVYEKDLALHLNLIPNTTAVIYYNASTDPYSNASTGAGGAWNSQLQNTLTSVIGEANYDIGHLFGASGGGGNAGCIGCVCTNGSKGSGFTSPADAIPQGDNFDIDYVVHEIGHQLGANHTFSMSNEGTGVNKEIGSGITIMGYAGITSQDVSGHSIDIYHEASIAQIQANLSAKTCAVTTNISATNATPVVAGVINRTIPISTPFALTGSASDGNAGDVLTYCWEENDNATSSQTGANSKASPTKATGPNWLSFRPTTSPTRLFPQLSTILAGGLTTGPLAGGDAGITIEALSSVSRTLNFRLTVRDNAPYSSTAPVSVGQTNFTDVVVTVTNTSGPFQVSSPNTALTWPGGSVQNITWAVANTTSSPVGCASVKISLSTDGGQTFPTVLSAGTANDGTEALTIPNISTTTARIKVEAVGNIFFDISNSNFTITAGSSCGTPTGLATSNLSTSGATVSWSAVSGALSYDADYKLSSSSTWIAAVAGTTSTSTIINGLAASSTYDWRVRTNCSGSSSGYATSQFTTTAATPVCNAPSGLSASNITTSGATVSWTSVTGATSYSADYKLTTSSTWTAAATGTTSTSVVINGLTSSTTYDWRVRTNCSSGASSYSVAQFTTATATGCQSIYDVSTNGATSGAAVIPFNTNITGLINVSGDVDYYKFTISTSGSITITLGTLPRDYDLKLYNSAGTRVGISQNSNTTGETINYTASAGTYYAQVYGYNGANSSTVCYTLKVQLGSASKGLNSIADYVSGSSGISVYPNPVVNTLNIGLSKDFSANSDFVLLDAKGKVVMQKRLIKNPESVDVSKLAGGIYLVKINNRGKLITEKFIKQ